MRARHVAAIMVGFATLLIATAAGIVLRFARSLLRPPGPSEPQEDPITRGWVFATPADTDLPWEEIPVPGPLGSMPAWHLPPTSVSADWVILVHGRTADRAETLRAVPSIVKAGWHALAVTYRNDAGAPRSIDGKYGLGSTEWEDIRAAVQEAERQGAQRIVLLGYSMGGLISLRAATELVRAGNSRLVGIALDSPALSWTNIITHHAELMRLPAQTGLAVTAVLGSAAAPLLTGAAQPIQWREIDGGNLAARASLPILLMHSAADAYVPIGPARQLAADLPDRVEFHEFPDAEHVRLWNADPERWERHLTEWLAGR